MQVRYNVMNITTLMSFANLKGRYHQNQKDVYFVRCVGSYPQYADDIGRMDRLLTDGECGGNGYYHRIAQLPPLTGRSEIERYREQCQEWLGSGGAVVGSGGGKYAGRVGAAVSAALAESVRRYHQVTPHASESMTQNLLIKLLYWLDTEASALLEHWSETGAFKFICGGSLKKQEYLFLYLLTRLGIDVMILNPAGDLQVDHRLLELSAELRLPDCGPVVIPPYDKMAVIQVRGTAAVPAGQPVAERSTAERPKVVNVRRADRDQRAVMAGTGGIGHRTESGRQFSSAPAGRSELSFEELALLASSIVMIEVHDRSGTCCSTGSGIMIGEAGYILTNCHVVRDGKTFGVRIEDDSTVYMTDELIKYNPVMDLALIRIDRHLKPIAICRGQQELVRGQRVVAIGSPLGLFNSVSDGIISGFRMISHKQMIQFTAPISHGSSGGAVLNMYGEVIGISTAGIDEGQNINLAVSCKDILDFVRGFVR